MAALNEKSKQNKQYVIAVLLFLLIVSVGFFSIKFFLDKNKEISTRTQELIADRANSVKMLSELDSVRGQHAEAETKMSYLNGFFTQDKIVALVRDLENTASATGNEITIDVADNNTPTRVVDTKNQEKILNFPDNQYVTVTINLSGRYDKTIEFIQRVKGLQYFNDIIALDMSIKDAKQNIQSRPSVFEPGQTPAEGQTAESQAAKDTSYIESKLTMVFYLENKVESKKQEQKNG